MVFPLFSSFSPCFPHGFPQPNAATDAATDAAVPGNVVPIPGLEGLERIITGKATKGGLWNHWVIYPHSNG